MERVTWMAAWDLLSAAAAIAALMAGSVCAPAQAQSAPATGSAPFIQPLPEPAEPTTRPADAPYIQPLPEPTSGPASQPATLPATQPTTSLATGAVTQPVGAAPKADEQKTLGFSPWVPVEPGFRCVDLSKMPSDVRELWQKHCTTKGRVLAERAARAAAIALLVGRVGDLAIGADLTVRKFLATTDQPDASAELFLHGATVRAVRYRADALVAEVEMDIRPRTLYGTLKGWARSHVNGHPDSLMQLENALLQADDTALLQIGRGAAPTEEILAPTPDLLKATRAATQPATQPGMQPATQPARSPAPPMKEPATATTAPVATHPTTRAAVPAR